MSKAPLDKSIGLRPHSSLRSACPNRSLRSLGALPGASGPRPAREKTGPGTPQPGRGPCGKCSLARIRLRNPRDEAAGRSPPVECTYSAHPSRRVCGRRPPRRQPDGPFARWPIRRGRAAPTAGPRTAPITAAMGWLNGLAQGLRNPSRRACGETRTETLLETHSRSRLFLHRPDRPLRDGTTATLVPLKCRFTVTQVLFKCCFGVDFVSLRQRCWGV